MRHILIFDFRSKEEFENSHIRDSINIQFPEFSKELLNKHLEQSFAKIKESNPKESDTLRRILIIPAKITDPNLKNIATLINSSNKDAQVAILKNGIEQFKSKFPFLFIKNGCSEAEYGISASRFPSIVSDNKLYIGNFLNACATKQLDLLGIKTLIGITPGPVSKMDKKFKYLHFPFMDNKNERQIYLLDFESIVNSITESIARNEKVMVFSMVFFRSSIIKNVEWAK